MIEIPQNIKQVLKEINLDFAEQQVYMSLLEKNLVSIAEIATLTKIPRSSIHLACENLLTRGVIKVSVSGKRRLFYLEHPDHLKNYVTFEENKLTQQKISLDTILPKLTTLYAKNQDSEPIDIELLQGEDGLVESYYRSLNQSKHGEVLRMVGDPTYFTIARDRLKKYREDRIKKRIFTRMLQPESPHAEFEVKDAKLKMRDVRILPKDLYYPNVQASVWQGSVAITVWDKGLHTVIIRNHAIAEFMKQLFEIAWNQAK